MEAKELEYVGFWPRFGAQFIDCVILLSISYPLLIGIYGWAYFGADRPVIAGPADFLISFVLPFVATIAFWDYMQATPGKMALSARIVDASTGRHAGIGQLIARYLAYIISAIPLGLGFIWVVFDGRKQAWHDKIAGTVVVRNVRGGPTRVQFDRG